MPSAKQLILTELEQGPITHKRDAMRAFVERHPETTITAVRLAVRDLRKEGTVYADSKQGVGTTIIRLVPPVVAEPEPPPTEEDIDGRPGRVAARLEKTLPGLVQESVDNAFANFMDNLLGAAGYHRGTREEDQEEIRRLHSYVNVSEAQITQYTAKIKELEGLVDFLNAEIDSHLTTNDRQPTTRDGLTINNLPDTLKKTGAHLFSLGWTAKRTRGGHIVFTDADGKNPVFSSSTPSDWRSTENMWRKFKQLGIQKPEGGI